MSAVTSISDFPRSDNAYAERATRLKRDCNRRFKSAQAMKGRGFICWHTPIAMNSGNLIEWEINAGGVQ